MKYIQYYYFIFIFAMLMTACPDASNRNGDKVKVGPDAAASLVVYFKLGTTEAQVEKFNQENLSKPRADGRGKCFKFGIGSYLRLIPSQANGHWAIAISFLADATEEERNNLDQVLDGDELVYKVFKNIAPNDIKASDLNTEP